MTTLHKATITQFGRTFTAETWALDVKQAKSNLDKKWKHAQKIENICNTGLTLAEITAKNTCSNDKTHTRLKKMKTKPQQWQPIETAPKDGTYILALDINKNIFHVLWSDYWMTVWGFSEVDATHWMPLPPEPNANT